MALVCWSGGCDSTMLLYGLLTQQPDLEVRTFSLQCSQIGVREEVEARANLRKEMNERGYEFDHCEMTLSLDEGDGLLEYGQPQAILWLLATQALRPEEDLYMGYIRGDDWHAGWFRSIFQTLQASSGRTGEIRTPLQWMSKADIIFELRDVDLLDLTWWCEFPDRAESGPCGKCGSCRKHETGLWQLERWGPSCQDIYHSMKGDIK